MKNWKIPYEYTVSGEIGVQANTLEEAYEKFYSEHFPVPENGSYVPESLIVPVTFEEVRYSYNGGQVDEKKRVVFESDEEIYRRMQLQYTIEDVKRHCEDLEIEEYLSDRDYQIIAEQFLDKQDCNIDQNSQYQNLIKNYLFNR